MKEQSGASRGTGRGGKRNGASGEEKKVWARETKEISGKKDHGALMKRMRPECLESFNYMVLFAPIKPFYNCFLKNKVSEISNKLIEIEIVFSPIR